MNRPSPRTVFLEALDQETADQRDAYLQSACGDDGELRAAVESLLAAHERPANPLDYVPRGLSVTPTLDVVAVEPSEHIGMTIGSYRLMELIGEGGFGLVFVAQQDKPVKRKVALKIIKPGTGSQEILARFNAERQAVAMMNHPHIAQIFDAGVTADSRPYFVMELVRGQPITDFCDAYGLAMRERLMLFQDVCAATQHAHQKGIIHRDLKPSNVMVTLHDEKPVVKVIDFGVAKATGQNLTDETIYTRYYSMIGTPLYMSPEQTAMSGLDVDTRSDVYSLGVLLYELLTGTTPFDRGRLDAAGYDEMRRIIREEEPPRPSVRLTTTTTRATHPAVLSTKQKTRRVRESIPCDVDWIVMKAMEKDRTRRYESAAAMSADVNRFLSKEPIEARPPARIYRLRRFASRNRVALLTGSLVGAALVAGTIVSLYQASIAIAARQEVEQFAERLKTANVLMGNARTLEDSQQYAQADLDHSEAVSLVPNYYLVWVNRATMRAKLHLWDEAAEDFSQAMRLGAPIDNRQWEGAAAIFYLTDRDDAYREIYASLMPPLDDYATTLSLHAIRSCVIAPTSEADIQRLVADAETILRREERPPGPPRGFRRGTSGPPLGRGAPHRQPGRPPGPEDRDRAPRNIKQYVAAWANLRAGNDRQALDLLDAAAQARGPSVEMGHALAAIAWHRLGKDAEAAEALRRADAALDRMVGEATKAEITPRPWIDFVEMVLLHREATRVATGIDIDLDPRLKQTQRETRTRLSL
jgi:serine/threonine protein kinase/Tfp pilus assembly protein PilF